MDGMTHADLVATLGKVGATYWLLPPENWDTLTGSNLREEAISALKSKNGLRCSLSTRCPVPCRRSGAPLSQRRSTVVAVSSRTRSPSSDRLGYGRRERHLRSTYAEQRAVAGRPWFSVVPE